METRTLHQTLDRLETVYDQQLLSFDTQVLPDLDAHIRERQSIFSELKETVGHIFKGSFEEADPEEIERIISRFESLRQQIHRLTAKVETHRNDLQTGMKRMTHGKQAIHAYGSPQSLRSRPRVITTRN